MMRPERGSMITDWRVLATPVVDDPRQPRNDEGDHRSQAPLQAARRPDAEERSHEEPEIEAAAVNQQAFQDVRVAAQMRAPHPAGLVKMRVRLFQSLAATPLQPTPPPAAHAATIRVD